MLFNELYLSVLFEDAKIEQCTTPYKVQSIDQVNQLRKTSLQLKFVENPIFLWAALAKLVSYR